MAGVKNERTKAKQSACCIYTDTAGTEAKFRKFSGSKNKLPYWRRITSGPTSVPNFGTRVLFLIIIISVFFRICARTYDAREGLSRSLFSLRTDDLLSFFKYNFHYFTLRFNVRNDGDDDDGDDRFRHQPFTHHIQSCDVGENLTANIEETSVYRCNFYIRRYTLFYHTAQHYRMGTYKAVRRPLTDDPN